MPFQPINPAHAIQQVAFGLVFGRALPAVTVDKVRVEAAPWRADLPAVDITQLVELRADATTGAMRPLVARGVEFSFKRPDGTAVTSMTIGGNEINIQTSAYTRWVPTWEKVQSYLLDVLRRIVDNEKPRGISVRSISLVFIDAFRSSESSPDFSEVLVRSPAVPSAIFDRGPLWHCHTGWFVSAPKGRVLNQVNIDTRAVTVTDPTFGQKNKSPEIIITHRQAMEFQPELALGDIVSDEHRSDIIGEFEAMHEANKREIVGLLTQSMREKIRIDQ